jgi:hypothetical protein
MRNNFYGAVCSFFLVVFLTMPSARGQEPLPPFVILGQCGVSFEACFNECRMTFPEGGAQWERGRLQCGNTCRKNRKHCETKAWSKLGIDVQSESIEWIPAARSQTRQIKRHQQLTTKPRPRSKEKIFQRTEKIENLYPQQKITRPVDTVSRHKKIHIQHLLRKHTQMKRGYQLA